MTMLTDATTEAPTESQTATDPERRARPDIALGLDGRPRLTTAAGTRTRTRPLIVAANRLPIRAGAGGTIEPSDGGLVRALLPVAMERGVRWVGSWPDGLPAPPSDGFAGMELDAITIEPALEEAFYAGYANRTLWPLLHGEIGRIEHDARWWTAYAEVNRRFADRLRRDAPVGAVVWVQDYHLFLVPAMLRRCRPDLRIGFFLHTPFPDVAALETVPQVPRIVQGLLGADLLGFQTDGDAARFVEAATIRCGAHALPEGLRWRDRAVQLVTAPASIDGDAFRGLSRRHAVRETAAAFRTMLGGRRIVLGVDRLDYTKAIPERFAGYEELLRAGVVDTAEVAFVQLAIPTRDTIPAYAAERSAVLAGADRINRTFSRSLGAHRDALLLHVGTVDLEQLVAMYVAADVMVVSPRADGMNLVAKEYCAARGDHRGALVLSRGAGAAAELTDAVLAENHRSTSVACAVRRALTLPTAEETRRMSRLHDHVIGHDATRWAASLLDDLGV